VFFISFFIFFFFVLIFYFNFIYFEKDRQINCEINCVALAEPGQYSNKKPKKIKKKALLFFKYGVAKLYLIFPIVRIFQITRKLVHNDVFVNARS
jgi:hypothetical protein